MLPKIGAVVDFEPPNENIGALAVVAFVDAGKKLVALFGLLKLNVGARFAGELVVGASLVLLNAPNDNGAFLGSSTGFIPGSPNENIGTDFCSVEFIGIVGTAVVVAAVFSAADTNGDVDVFTKPNPDEIAGGVANFGDSNDFSGSAGLLVVAPKLKPDGGLLVLIEVEAFEVIVPNENLGTGAALVTAALVLTADCGVIADGVILLDGDNGNENPPARDVASVVNVVAVVFSTLSVFCGLTVTGNATEAMLVEVVTVGADIVAVSFGVILGISVVLGDCIFISVEPVDGAVLKIGVDVAVLNVTVVVVARLNETEAVFSAVGLLAVLVPMPSTQSPFREFSILANFDFVPLRSILKIVDAFSLGFMNEM